MMQNSSLGKTAARFSALATVLLVAVLAGCASAPRMTDAEQARLLERVESRWRALEQRDFGAAYEFTSPAYREVFSKSLYEKKFSYMVEWELTGVEFLTYDADAAVASVAARVMSKPVKHTSAASAALGAIPRKQVEKWVFVDGQWWFSV
ncbi:hypothetical protein [Chromatocurvus halotolerans]|uniref:DUF4440 domain-containing protein n=1 Tax=Chromatocurvus halotolerans TaxID=1132028 RepID=A0A4R2KLH8_9GAMM|nr:hypothetical protein [Chromatocurvus halotolerans]TCO74901.1 hypothetical protein EV688_11158 [Chromatocurvus halotolerans]